MSTMSSPMIITDVYQENDARNAKNNTKIPPKIIIIQNGISMGYLTDGNSYECMDTYWIQSSKLLDYNAIFYDFTRESEFIFFIKTNKQTIVFRWNCIVYTRLMHSTSESPISMTLL